MKTLLVVCAAFAFIGMLNLPYGYYTFLRFIVTAGAVAVLVTEFKNEFTASIILFGVIAILFNPFIPIYLYSKALWAGIDFIVGVIFVVKAFSIESK